MKNLDPIFELLDPLLSMGLEVAVKKRGEIYLVDVNTGAKPHCYLWINDGQIVAETRYNNPMGVYSLHELAFTVASCMYGRSYINPIWWKYLCKLGIAKEEKVDMIKKFVNGGEITCL